MALRINKRNELLMTKEQIRERREALGLTSEEFAERLGMTGEHCTAQ
jgi:DNA-binding transcriptional regulator YiaG